MRKYGTSLLQSFAEGPSLIAPDQLGSLRALAECQNEGLIAGAVRAIAGGLGISQRAVREEASVSVDAVCATMGAAITDRAKAFAFSDGVAIIPVWGALLHRDGYCDSQGTGYDYIRAKFDAALADPDVKGIVFDVNSPGGHVAGNFELADEIYAARSAKPTLAIVDSMCYSGGYSLGSSASRMVVTPSGGVGSIGVVMMHVSVQQLVEKWGVDVNFIHAGAHKVDGNMFTSLPDDVRSRYQASVERSYEKFVALVARNRSMSADAVRATEALRYDAEEGLAIGLIDAIQTPKEALAAFRKELTGSTTTTPLQGAKKMSHNTLQNGEGGESTRAAADTAIPADQTGASVTAAAPDGAAAERARIHGITSCEEASGREELAKHFAFETNMGVEEARKALAAAPKQSQTSTASGFVAAMDGSDNPNVGIDGGKPSEMTVGQRIATSYHSFTGGAHRKTDQK